VKHHQTLFQLFVGVSITDYLYLLLAETGLHSQTFNLLLRLTKFVLAWKNRKTLISTTFLLVRVNWLGCFGAVLPNFRKKIRFNNPLLLGA